MVTTNQPLRGYPAATASPCSTFSCCTRNNDAPDVDSEGSMPFVPSFAKCCSSSGAHNRRQLRDELTRPDAAPFDELPTNTDKKSPAAKWGKKGEMPPPVATVEAGEIPNVASALSDAHGFLPVGDKNDDDGDDDSSDEESIDLFAEFRREVEAAEVAAGAMDRCETPAQTSSSPRRKISSPVVSGRRLGSGKRPSPSLPRPDEDSTFENLDGPSSPGGKAKSDGAPSTIVVTAVKGPSNSRAGVVFCRSKSPFASESTIVSRLLPNSVFRRTAVSEKLVGATVVSVNDAPVTDPRRAAELVHAAEGVVQLTVKLASPGGTDKAVAPTPSFSANSVSSSRKEIDSNLMKHERKIKEQFAGKKRQQQQKQDGDADKKESEDSHSTADWSQAATIEKAFPKGTEGRASTAASKSEQTVSQQARADVAKDASPAESPPDAPAKFSPAVIESPPAGQTGSRGEVALAEEAILPVKLVDERLPKTPPKKEWAHAKEDEGSKEGKAKSEEKGDDKDEDAEGDGAQRTDQATSGGPKKTKSKSKSKMRFKRAFGLKKGKSSKKDAADDGEAISSPPPMMDVPESEAEEAIDPNVSADEILNDLGSVRSSMGSKGSKGANRGRADAAKPDAAKPNAAKSDAAKHEAAKTEASNWSERGKPSPGAATIPGDVLVAARPQDGGADAGEAILVKEDAGPYGGGLSALSMATERATSFIVGSIVSNLSGTGYDRSVTEEAVFAFPSEEDAAEKDVEKEEEEAGAEEGANGEDDASDANMPVEAVLAAKAPSPPKKKGFLKRFKKISKVRKTSDVDHVVVEPDETPKEDAVVSDAREVVRDQAEALTKDEAAVSEDDEPPVDDEAKTDGAVEDQDGFGGADADTTQESFFKRAIFKKKSKRSPIKTQRGPEAAVPLVAYGGAEDQGNAHEDQDIASDEADAGENHDEAADDENNADGVNLNVMQGSFFKRAFKMKQALRKKQRDSEETVPVADVEDQDNACGERSIVSGESEAGDADEEDVPNEDAAVEGDASAGEEHGSDDEDQGDPHDITLNMTPTGEIEVHTPSKKDIFDCPLSPISSSAGPTSGKPLGTGASDVTLRRSDSNNDATASLSLTDESVTIDNNSLVTPPPRPTSVPAAALPPTPLTPKKTGEHWELSTGLFGDEGPPSPCGSVVGGGGGTMGPAIAAPRHHSFECQLQQANASVGRKESVNVSMEVLGDQDPVAKEGAQPATPPPVNRKQNFDCTDDFNDSLYKPQFKSMACVDVTTVYREDGGLGFDEGADEIQTLARTKQHAFDIVKQSKMSANSCTSSGAEAEP